MSRGSSTLFATAALCAAARAGAAQSVPLAPNARAVRVGRAGEVIRAAPDGNSARRGTAARGALLPALEAALGAGCASRWIRVGPAAWMCQDAVELSAAAPAAPPQPAVPPGEVVPYQYGFAGYAGVATYRRLEDAAGDDRAEELERGMGVAVTGVAQTADGTFARTAGGRWIAHRDLNWARPSLRQGVRYEPGEVVGDVGFARRRAHTWPTPERAAVASGGGQPQGFLDERAPVHVRERAEVRGVRVVRTDGGWIAARALRFAASPPPPADAGVAERWADVDTRQQVLVAFEGARPVYAALVSSGRRGHPTRPGAFRVWIKLAVSNMSNADSDRLTSAGEVYSVERVPWVMFFHDDQALHGAYWHDRFGTARSHGCVNLAPLDARWLFDWAPPAMPPGWDAVFPRESEPGMLVRVR